MEADEGGGAPVSKTIKKIEKWARFKAVDEIHVHARETNAFGALMLSDFRDNHNQAASVPIATFNSLVSDKIPQILAELGPLESIDKRRTSLDVMRIFNPRVASPTWFDEKGKTFLIGPDGAQKINVAYTLRFFVDLCFATYVPVTEEAQLEEARHFVHEMRAAQESKEVQMNMADVYVDTINNTKVNSEDGTVVETFSSEAASALAAKHLSSKFWHTAQTDTNAEILWVLEEEQFTHNILLCEIPCMVGSKWCNTVLYPKLFPPCRYGGGYFVTGKVPKVIEFQERLSFNRLFVYEGSTLVNPKSQYMAQVRSHHPTRIRTTSTTYFVITKEAVPRVLVSAPTLLEHIPVREMFRLLGFDSEESLQSMLNFVAPNISLSARAIAKSFLRHDPERVRSIVPSMASARLERIPLSSVIESDTPRARTVKEWNVAWLVNVLKITIRGEVTSVDEKLKICEDVLSRRITHEFLPHVGTDNSELTTRTKALVLMDYVVTLAKTYLNEIPLDDRDDIDGKRYMCCTVFALLFRQIMIVHRKFITAFLKMRKEPRKSKKAAASSDEIRGFSPRNIVGGAKVSSMIMAAFRTGNFTLDKFTNANSGICQPLATLNEVAAKSHFLSMHTPGNREGKSFYQRLTKPRDLGGKCPSSSPEGTNCGSIHDLPIGATLRSDTPIRKWRELKTSGIMDILRRADIGEIPLTTPFERSTFERSEGEEENVCLISFDGCFIGAIPMSAKMRALDALRQARRDGHLHPMLSVLGGRSSVEVPRSPEEHNAFGMIQVQSEEGAVILPMFNVGKVNEILDRDPSFDFLRGVRTFEDAIRMGLIEFLSIGEIYDQKRSTGLRVAHSLGQVLGLKRADLDPTVDRSSFRKEFVLANMHPSAIFGLSASLTPFPEFNQSPRNFYASAMGKQGAQGPIAGDTERMEERHTLMYSQVPLASTDTERKCLEAPRGVNVILAIHPMSGENREDALILNRASVERGLFGSIRSTVVRASCPPPKKNVYEVPENPTLDAMCVGVKEANYGKIGLRGSVPLRTKIEEGDVIFGQSVVTNDSKKSIKRDVSVVASKGDVGIVTQLVEFKNMDGSMVRAARIDEYRSIQEGDKASMRNGQKGVISYLISQEDMPTVAFGKNAGMVPDLVFNPHSFPSRMTGAMLVEMLASKIACLTGEMVDATAFSGVNPNDLAETLRSLGFSESGKEMMIDGRTGELQEAAIFIGSAYYQRLKHQVKDKAHARATGPNSMLSRQPSEGRAMNGGQRAGEMEKDVMVGHGVAVVLNDRMVGCSDGTLVPICRRCGGVAMMFSFGKEARSDRPAKDRGSGFCYACGPKGRVKQVTVPYSFLNLVYELGAMGIKMGVKIQKKVVG